MTDYRNIKGAYGGNGKKVMEECLEKELIIVISGKLENDRI